MSENYWTRVRKPSKSAGFGAAMRSRAVTRRRFLSSVAVATGAGVLIACGGSDDKSSSGTGASSATQAPAGTQAAAQATAAPKGGTLTTTNIATDAKSFHPYQTTDTASSSYQGYIYGGGSLLKYDPQTLEQVGLAASKWEFSPDKKTVTFTLKDNKWSDGTPVTSADYLWTYQQVSNPANKYPYLENLEDITAYEAPDPKTIKVTLREASVVGLSTSDAVNPLPKHIWEKLDWGDPVKNSEINNPTLSNGMWKLKEWKRDQQATFVGNPSYIEGAPNLESLVVRQFGTQALSYQALKAGEVDWSGFAPSDYKEAKTLSNINVYEYYLARGAWNYVGFNLRRPALKDPNVRKAIAYATDRKGIIDAVAFGLGRPTYSAYPQSSPVYNANVEKYDFDPKKSADLFKAAGYALENKKLVKDGRPLTLKMYYNTGNVVREGIATVLQQQLQELGATVDVQGIEFQAYLDLIKKEPYDYDLFVLGWSSTIEPYFAYQIWSEKTIPALNSGAYVNPRVDKLYQDSKYEFDLEKRKGMFGEIQKIIADELPYVFLYESLSYSGVNKKIGGITPTRLGISYNLNQWFQTK